MDNGVTARLLEMGSSRGSAAQDWQFPRSAGHAGPTVAARHKVEIGDRIDRCRSRACVAQLHSKTSAPSPPESVSLSVPPTSRSRPAPAGRTSAPAPPSSRSCRHRQRDCRCRHRQVSASRPAPPARSSLITGTANENIIGRRSRGSNPPRARRRHEPYPSSCRRSWCSQKPRLRSGIGSICIQRL